MTSPSTGSEATAIRVLVICIGNRFRRDDAVGPVVADRLRERGVETVELGGDGVELMDAWAGGEHVILVDAARSGATAGSIHHFDAISTEVPSGLFHYSSHQFSVAEAIEMARVLGRLPPKMGVYGIEGKDFSYGQELSAEVEGALETVTQAIVDEIENAAK
ncbi:MAG: hydrogenase maturation protease [Rhodospirillales bacterium]|nr:hydrogenase maturation protease [Rhodospirillales bacterium]